MGDLDRLINDAFANGSTGVTIWPSMKHGFQGNVRNPDGSWSIMMGREPAQALRNAIGSLGRGKRRRDDADLL